MGAGPGREPRLATRRARRAQGPVQPRGVAGDVAADVDHAAVDAAGTPSSAGAREASDSITQARAGRRRCAAGCS